MILVPAHDEETGIAETVTVLRAVIPPAVRILVIADNCGDRTAEHARKAGAEVVERHDPDARGKGFALAFGRDALAADPPQVVLVIDADCRLQPGSCEALIEAVVRTGRPVQAHDVIQPDLTLQPLAQISGFAMLVKNVVRLRGLMRLGGFSLLCGTGMAFPWESFASARLATGNVVEDLGLAVAMIGSGTRPMLIEDACVISRAAAVADSVAQRSRWEHGFLQTALHHALPELAGGIVSANRARVALGLHLLVPPLALLIAVSGAALIVVGALSWLAGTWLPTGVLAGLLVLALLAVAGAWLREGRQTLQAGALLRAPLYVAWKIPMYVRMLGRQTLSWNRTRREGGP